MTDLVPRRRSPVVESDSGERERIATQIRSVTILARYLVTGSLYTAAARSRLERQ